MRTPFVITPPDRVAMQIGDVVVEFVGDPPPESFAALLNLHQQYTASDGITDQLAVIGGLREGLRDLLAPESRDAYQGLVDRGLLSMVVLMRMFAHLIESYGEAVGFPPGTSSPSPNGLPGTAATSAG